MSNELPKIGLYVQWAVNGQPSEKAYLPASEKNPVEVADALAALVPDGVPAEVVGFTMGNADTVWFGRTAELDALQQFKRHAMTMPTGTPPRSRL